MIEDKKLNPTRDVLHDRNVISLLEKLGLSRNAVKCYLASLTLGSATVSEIAKAAHVNRVNAYGAISALAKYGLIEQVMNKKGRLLHPAPLEQLQALAHGLQKNATKTRWRVEDLVPQLRALALQHPDQPRVLFFEGGKKTWHTVYERALRAAPGSEILFIGAYLKAIAGAYDDEHFIPERMKRGVYARVLNHKTPELERLKKRDHHEMRETRFLPSGVMFPCSIMIYNDEVSFLWGQDTNFERTIGIVLQGSAIAGVMRTVFEMAWNIAAHPARPRIKK